jgi:hypothetical protein
VDEVTRWLTGFTQDEIDATSHPAPRSATSSRMRPSPEGCAHHGCDLRCQVQEITDPLMQQIRYLDKLVDEVARGKAMEKILRA